MLLIGRRLSSYPEVECAVPAGTKGERVETTTGDVVALGRHSWYGDFAIRILARLADDSEVHIVMSEQGDETVRWLRTRLRAWKRQPWATRETGYSRVWEDDQP